ncbi:N-acetylglucosamine-6-phosphate deacetylase [Segetibacter aerophilus]|uniref:N-acetylglucosamine-6-phosphate deacetylase n=1 Tax=Segetibacter aerophilus TaxID=670293 RepID=A0A512BHC1_9BACT|nr:N-acetylglucosamine-6-phosphate deacetylase [Segetibacter aerophilus]GEO11378.1 N-acetylglucosamine-6-phosphate deacetylase [Segetibacter aerophilus]
METKISPNEKVIIGTNCITNKTQQLVFQNDKFLNILATDPVESGNRFIGPGLLDLQINGINGIDFNNPALTSEKIVAATHYLLSQGVTTYLPTVITNSDENILQIVQTINNACLLNSLVNDCIWGIHLEGPFISPVPGAKGAHDEKYIKPPDWKLFQKFQQAAGGRIKLITLAPEWEGAYSFIQKCKEHNVLVSIGHSMANAENIRLAVEAGASLSTHLGNGVPLTLPRHPNIIWDQLGTDELYTCLITDGIHIPDPFIKVAIKSKGEKALIVSDATRFAGMEPGEYESHIGGVVVVDKDKRVSLKSFPGLLAGAAKNLLENVETLIDHNLCSLSQAWSMASVNVASMLLKNKTTFSNKDDIVVFSLKEKKIQIETVIKSGVIVHEK